MYKHTVEKNDKNKLTLKVTINAKLFSGYDPITRADGRVVPQSTWTRHFRHGVSRRPQVEQVRPARHGESGARRTRCRRRDRLNTRSYYSTVPAFVSLIFIFQISRENRTKIKIK